MKIYFLIDDPNALEQRDRILRRYCSWHYWQQDAGDSYFGVAHPRRDSYAEEIAELIESFGGDVLPALNDPDTPVTDKVKSKLKKHGVGQNDKTKDIAKKMHDKSGFKPLKPTYF